MRSWSSYLLLGRDSQEQEKLICAAEAFDSDRNCPTQWVIRKGLTHHSGGQAAQGVVNSRDSWVRLLGLESNSAICKQCDVFIGLAKKSI